jgi:arsenate reductase
VTASEPAEKPIRHLLFVCNHNAGRSQMAQAFFERDGPQGVRAESAGTEPAPEIWPPVVEVMRELGIDLSGRTPKRLTVAMQRRASWAVTMGCGDACPYVPAIVQAWEIPDPAGKPREDIRAIRDQIQQQVRALIDAHIDTDD